MPTAAPSSLLHAARGTGHASWRPLLLCLAAQASCLWPPAARAGAAEPHPVARVDAVAAAAPSAALPRLPATPHVRASGTLVSVPIRPWLPAAGGFGVPRLLPADQRGPAPLRPTMDTPPLAIVPPPLRKLEAAPAAYAAAPDATDVVRLPLGTNAGRSLPPRAASVPPARPVEGPRRVATDAPQAARLRPTSDQPPLARDRSPFEPRVPAMATAPLAYALSPDPRLSPLVSAAFVAKADRPAMTDDPTWGLSRAAAIARAPELQRPSAAFVRLAIPDPFEIAGLVAFRQPPADDAPPSAAPGLPPRPTLPAAP